MSDELSKLIEIVHNLAVSSTELAQEVRELKQVLRYVTKEVCPWHDSVQTPEELARRKANSESLDLACTEHLDRARAKNPNLTQEEENDLVGDFYLGLMGEYADEGEILEFAQKLLS